MVRVIAAFENPDPLSVPVIDFPLTVAVRFIGLYPGDDMVRPTVGAEYVPVTVSAIDVAPAMVPVPVTAPDVSANTSPIVNAASPDVPLPVQLPARVVLGPEESPLHAARERSTARLNASGRTRALIRYLMISLAKV